MGREAHRYVALFSHLTKKKQAPCLQYKHPPFGCQKKSALPLPSAKLSHVGRVIFLEKKGFAAPIVEYGRF